MTANDHIVVEQDVAGNVPIGEQYNDFFLITTAFTADIAIPSGAAVVPGEIAVVRY